MSAEVKSRKRGFLVYSKDIGRAATVLDRRIDVSVAKKVYPLVAPQNPRQYVDVTDEFDLRFQQQNSKRRLLNF